MNLSDNPLKKLIAPNLYNHYSSILSLSDIPLFLLDTNGDILLELIPSPSFCSHICQECKSKICSDYLDHFNCKTKIRFTCKHGLENVIFPIIVDNNILGYIAGLRVYLKKNEYKKYLIDILSFDENESKESVAKSIASLDSVNEDKIKVQEQLCGQIAKNVSLDLYEIINNNNNDIKRLSVEKEMLEKKIIDLESKNMSLAVNPHFLFNTLNCIARIAYFENSPTTEELIYCLSDLLRYNLKQDNQLHTIDVEISNIEKYLYIQKARFKNRLKYEIDLSEEIRFHTILNMVIQPIVENAIIHGIAPKRDGGHIKITGQISDNKIIISVLDDGNGFPEEFLAELNSDKPTPGLGFQNTDKRLRQYYGSEYGLTVVKSDYSGSIVDITIPTKPIVR